MGHSQKKQPLVTIGYFKTASNKCFLNNEGYKLIWNTQTSVHSVWKYIKRLIRIFDQLADSSVNKRKVYTNSAVKDNGKYFG